MMLLVVPLSGVFCLFARTGADEAKTKQSAKQYKSKSSRGRRGMAKARKSPKPAGGRPARDEEETAASVAAGSDLLFNL